MRKLHLTFLNEDGSKKTLIIHCVNQELTPEAVKAAMEEIVNLELFEKDGLRLMTKVHSAKYVEIIETPLFANDNEMALPVPVPPVEEVPNTGEEAGAVSDVDKPETQPRNQKQLAKIYPFGQKSVRDNHAQVIRGNKENQCFYQQENSLNQQVIFSEKNTPLFDTASNKPILYLVEFRNKRAVVIEDTS